MKRVHILRRTTPVADIDMYDDYGQQSTGRAERVRVRRLRQIKHQLI